MVAVPGSTMTEIFGLNDEGVAVGMYTGAYKKTHGFVYSGGTLKTVGRPQRHRYYSLERAEQRRRPGRFLH